jgi:formylglycine-generating enzyme required for sulfatase activity
VLVLGWVGYQRGREAAVRQARAATLVESLGTADTAAVPGLVDELETLADEARPLLEQALARARKGSRDELHTRLALLKFDPGQAKALATLLPDARPAEVLVARRALRPYRDRCAAGLWRLLQDPEADPGRRLRAAAALAAFDPDIPRWLAVSHELAGWMVAENLLHVAHWAEAFRPVRGALLSPLTAIYSDPERRPSERDLAATLLADYAADRPALLADLATRADDRQLNLLWPALRAQRQQLRPLLTRMLNRARAAPDSGAAGRQANAAVTLARLGEWEPVWPLLRHSPDPAVRSWLIHRLGRMGTDPGKLLERFRIELDPSARRALVLALGEYPPRRLGAKDRLALVKTLVALYRDHPDPGLRGAIGWLLRQRWGQGSLLDRVDRELAGKRPGERRWLVNTQRQTFVLFAGPVLFRMGSPASEADREEDLEARHLRRIPRSFAVADREVTVAQYLRFRKKFPYRKKYSPAPDGPIINITWYDAVAYCRWLSEQEGVPEEQMCYPALDRIGPGMKLPANCLERTGYRLPTEAEWEFACRAGASTSRCYGEDKELLGQYGWYATNSADRARAGGQLKPNDFGLFDMHGNAWEWCHDRQKPYPPSGGSADDALAGGQPVRETEPRVLRGGAFGWHAALIRSARRNAQVPSYNYHLYGFRLARTLRSPLRKPAVLGARSKPMISKIVSGGQTGVDRAALDLALEIEFPCGGWCPKGRKAEDGPLPPRYPLKETASEVYAERTEANVRDSDGTLVLVQGPPEGGTRLTIDLAVRQKKPYMVVNLSEAADPVAVRQWLDRHGIRVLNVAGPRESEVPGVYARAKTFLQQLLALPGVIAS